MDFKTKKNIRLILIIIIVAVLALTIFKYAKSNLDTLNQIGYGEKKDSEKDKEKKNRKEFEEKEELETAEDKVKETFIFGKIAEDSFYYSNHSKDKEHIGSFAKGQIVEIIKDRSRQWYFVKAKDGQEGWVPSTDIVIPDDPETNCKRMAKEEIEEYINQQNFTSDTDYLIWVDIDRQLTHVLLKEENNWNLDRTMLSATGKNASPTIKGLYKIQDRDKCFYNERLGSGAKNWVRFEGVYLFHSLATDKRGNIMDYTLGKRASDGCVRLSLEDSKWFFDNIEEDSTVFIH